MKYLLDTHVLIWTLFEPKKLSNKFREAILDINNDIFVSPISFWEISLKYSLKKLELKNIKPEQLPEFTKKSGISISDIDVSLLASFHKLPRLKHKDPFDRMLVWEAINKKYHLITQDKDLKVYQKLGLKLL